VQIESEDSFKRRRIRCSFAAESSGTRQVVGKNNQTTVRKLFIIIRGARFHFFEEAAAPRNATCIRAIPTGKLSKAKYQQVSRSALGKCGPYFPNYNHKPLASQASLRPSMTSPGPMKELETNLQGKWEGHVSCTI
jgi:hypothetical protein